MPPTTRATVSPGRRQPALRPARAMPCASPKIPKPKMMNSVPPHENS